jgi:tight adherence protein C
MTASAATDIALAVLLGGAFGIGVCLVLAVTPRWGAPHLERRIAPYIRDIADPRGLTPATPLRGSVWQALQTRATAALGGSESVSARLAQAGRADDVAAFRGRQLAWAIVGLVVGGAALVLAAVVGRFSVPIAAVPIVTAATGALLCDLALTRAARLRLARVSEELPTVLEFVALCLSAGETILDALRRVGGVGAGELTAELRTAVLAVGTGSSLGDALILLARRLQLPALTRAVDHLVAALDRGAPLAQVLQAQATDAREEAKRGLIERAGRKEILMLLPLVFLILPLSVLFAVFPGVFMLRLGLG